MLGLTRLFVTFCLNLTAFHRASDLGREGHEGSNCDVIKAFQEPEARDSRGSGLHLAGEEPGQDSEEHPGLDENLERARHQKNLLPVCNLNSHALPYSFP